MHKSNELDDHVLTNRQKAQRIVKDLFWCGGCDAQLVGEIGKCPNCGWDNSSSYKKSKRVP